MTPVPFGALQDVSMDISSSKKELYGQRQFPLAVARGTGKIDCKAKAASFSAMLFPPGFGRLHVLSHGAAASRAMLGKGIRVQVAIGEHQIGGRHLASRRSLDSSSGFKGEVRRSSFQVRQAAERQAEHRRRPGKGHFGSLRFSPSS